MPGFFFLIFYHCKILNVGLFKVRFRRKKQKDVKDDGIYIVDKMYFFQDTDYNMSVKSTEFHSLQSEYDTLSSTLKQLTNQKDVAQKRLDDLDVQVRNMDEKGQMMGV